MRSFYPILFKTAILGIKEGVRTVGSVGVHRVPVEDATDCTARVIAHRGDPVDGAAETRREMPVGE